MLRQYTITCKNDTLDIENGRCPSYAIEWSAEQNQKHWSHGHDYFMGNKENTLTNNTELRKILSKKLSYFETVETRKIIFCDLDGVLTDFDKQVFNKFKKPPSEVAPSLLWSVINKSNTFFENMEWKPRGKELWNEIKQYDPVILTGATSNKSIMQKKKWVERELGPDVHFIACPSKNKPNYCLKNSILIDDMERNKDAWTKKQGVFLLYNEANIENIIQEITSLVK